MKGNNLAELTTVKLDDATRSALMRVVSLAGVKRAATIPVKNPPDFLLRVLWRSREGWCIFTHPCLSEDERDFPVAHELGHKSAFGKFDNS